MKKFIFHWRDGSTSEGKGNTVEDAFTHLGYGAGAAAALDYYEETKVCRTGMCKVCGRSFALDDEKMIPYHQYPAALTGGSPDPVLCVGSNMAGEIKD